MHENMAAWLEKLRTTRLPQGEGQLRTGAGEYCCLGIACLTAGRSWQSLKDEEVLDIAVTKWLGLEPDDMHDEFDLQLLWPAEVGMPRGFESFHTNHLTATFLNDIAALTFSQIADMVEYFGVEAKGER